MIGTISLWLKSVIAVVILGSCVEMILPDGKMQRYITFAVGLVVLMAVAGPVLSVEDEPLLPKTAVEQTDYHVDTGQIAAAAEAQIKAELSVDYVRVELNDNLEVTDVYVNNASDAQIVADFLGLPVEQIRVEEDANGKPAR